MKALLILSGGMDSATLLYDLRAAGDAVEALSFDYGQRHHREVEAARALCQELELRHDVVDLRGVGALLSIGGGALLGAQDVPEGHYADESMKATVVPNRNMILLAVAGGVAIARKLDVIAYAAHAGDHTIYPDCRQVFASALDAALRLADWHEIGLHRPFVAMTKAQIATRGRALGVPFERTWSCYRGGEVHCGRCGTCVERREAFAIAGIADPTSYECSA